MPDWCSMKHLRLVTGLSTTSLSKLFLWIPKTFEAEAAIDVASVRSWRDEPQKASMKGRHGKVGGPRTHRDARKEEREVGQASQYLVYRVRNIRQGKNETHCSSP